MDGTDNATVAVSLPADDVDGPTPSLPEGPIPEVVLPSPEVVLPSPEENKVDDLNLLATPSALPEQKSPSLTLGPHCNFVILAEFDIDKGSVVRAQYPAPSGIPESKLSELMLPEGAHLRDLDFTVFFLKLSEFQGEVHATNDADDEDPEQDFLCCLNVVMTRKVKEARRGAVVKAMAIITRHRFYSIYKNLLMTAISDVFDGEESPDVVCILYWVLLRCRV